MHQTARTREATCLPGRRIGGEYRIGWRDAKRRPSRVAVKLYLVLCLFAVSVFVIWALTAAAAFAESSAGKSKKIALATSTGVFPSGAAAASTKRRPEERTVENVEVTAYTFRREETDGTPCIAASGADVCRLERKGDHSCAANFLKFGTVVYVPGFGECTVRDRLAVRFRRRIDLGFGVAERLKAAKTWGFKRLDIQVIR